MGRYLDIGGTRYLLEQLHDIMEKMLVGDIDLSNYVTQTELQKILDELQINVDLSAYATKEELENAIKGIDLSAYATREEIPSLDGYATEEYVDNALVNVPTGEVDLSNYYNKEEVDEKDLMIAPINAYSELIVTDNMPDIKAYTGTNTITFEEGVEVYGGILVSGASPYYFNDYAEIDYTNVATFEAESECNVKDYIFIITRRPEGLTALNFTVTNGAYRNSYSIPLHELDDGQSEYDVYYRKIWNSTLFIKRTKLRYAQNLMPTFEQIYENRNAIKELQNNGTGTDGKDGEDGFSPIATVTKTDGVVTISITDVNGTTTVTVSDGVNGEDGKDGTNGTNGTDGVTPHIDETTKHWFIGENDTGVLAEGINGVDGKDGTNGVNGTNGQDGADGYTPVRGTDYWTEQDIQTIKDYIDTELGVIENGSY